MSRSSEFPAVAKSHAVAIHQNQIISWGAGILSFILMDFIWFCQISIFPDDSSFQFYWVWLSQRNHLIIFEILVIFFFEKWSKKYPIVSLVLLFDMMGWTGICWDLTGAIDVSLTRPKKRGVYLRQLQHVGFSGMGNHLSRRLRCNHGNKVISQNDSW